MKSEQNQPGKAQPRLVFLGGFLGAGKSTAAGQLARFLKNHGKTSGVITNDHGAELVDSTIFRAQGITTESLQGGEICGRASEFASLALRMAQSKDAEIIIGEPVGTCVNLIGDLMEPLYREYRGKFSFAPLSVLVDPVRASQVVHSEPTAGNSYGLDALFRRQLAEADLIVINKADQLSPRQLDELRSILADEYAGTPMFSVSATTGSGLDEWFECLMSKDWKPRPVTAATKAEPMTQLAWLNCTVSVSSVRYFEAGKLLMELGSCVQALLQQEGAGLVRMKMALKPDHDSTDIAVISMVHPDSGPKLLREVSEPIQRGELMLSARTEGDPEILHSVVNRAILATMEHSTELFARMQHCEHFRLGKPRGETAVDTALETGAPI